MLFVCLFVFYIIILSFFQVIDVGMNRDGYHYLLGTLVSIVDSSTYRGINKIMNKRYNGISSFILYSHLDCLVLKCLHPYETRLP